jgi:hypothetical protein
MMAVLLAILAFVAFLPVLGNGFVQLDDHHNFLYNPHYRGLGRAEITWAWTTELLGVYQPLGWMLLEAEYVAVGLEPAGYHLTSLLLHSLTAVALFFLTLALVGRALPAVLAANPKGVVLGSALAVALFAVHPLRVEAVAWVSCQTYLPCAAMAVLATRAYLRAADAPPRRRVAGLTVTCVLFALALLFKATAVALPAVFLVLDYEPLRRLGRGPGRWFGPAARRVWTEKVPFLAVSLVFAVLAIHAKISNDSVLSLEQRGPMSRIAQSCYGACFYLWKTVWPTGLCTYYPGPNRFDWRAPSYLACAALLAAASAALFRLRRRHPGLLAAWVAYLTLLAPNSGLVPIDDQVATDRYSYLATMAWVPLLAAAIARLTGPGHGRGPITIAVTAAGLGLIAVLSASSWMLCRTWRDTAALAAHAIAHGGRNPQIYLSLGQGLEQRGDLSGAEASFAEALQLEPSNVPAMVMLGMARLRQGQIAEAIALLTEAVRLQPDMPEAHNILGSALASEGRYAEAAAQFAEALRLRPHFGEARASLARVQALMRPGGL